METSPLPIVVLISGTGSNLLSLIRARDEDHLPVDIRRVISNLPGVQGIERAADAKIDNLVVDHRLYGQREEFEEALGRAIDTVAPRMIVLAGFMRVLTDGFVDRYAGRMINLHPSLLPAYRGLNTYERCLADNVKVHGTSIHYVTRELDGGPVIAQATVQVRPKDTAGRLRRRVQAREHVLLPEVLRWLALGKITLGRQGVEYEGRKLDEPIRLTEDDIIHFPDGDRPLPSHA